MGNLINPVSSRLGYVKYWNSVWSITTPTLYSLNSTLNIKLEKYIFKIFYLLNKRVIKKKSIIKNKRWKWKFFFNTTEILSYKLLRKNNINYFLVYLKLSFFKKNELEKKLITIWNSVFKYYSFFKKKYKIKKFLKGVSFYKKPFVKFISSSIILKKKLLLLLPPRKNKVTDKVTTVTKIFFKVSNSVLRNKKNKKFLKKIQKTIKYDVSRNRVFSRVLFLKTSSYLKGIALEAKPLKYNNIILNDSKITNNNVSHPLILQNIIKMFFIWYIMYRIQIQPLKVILNKMCKKFLGTVKNFFIFIRIAGFSITAGLLAEYFVSRLKQNFPIQPLVKLFLRQMRYQFNKASILGFKLVCSGRFARRGRATYMWKSIGRIPNTNYELDLDYALKLVTLTNSICAIKIWLVRSTQVKKIQVF